MANVIAGVQRPTIVIAHNKTLAAQLATEFKDFLPNNAVEYFVSYYDYYQPEAYVPRTDTYIEKDADVNDELDKLRHAATRALLTRRDVVIVASVSCIFGLGSPEEYQELRSLPAQGRAAQPQPPRAPVGRHAVRAQRLRPIARALQGSRRHPGNTCPPTSTRWASRVEFWGDEIDRIVTLDPLTGELLGEVDDIEIYPAKHFVTSDERLQMAIASIEQELDEHLSRLKADRQAAGGPAPRVAHPVRPGDAARNRVLRRRRELLPPPGPSAPPGAPPYTLMDYFPEDYLVFIDESHMTLPQIRAMYGGDRSRKEVLVDFGFRLPSALDNRPLNFGRVRAARQPDNLHLRHARPLRVRAQPADRRTGHPAHRPHRPRRGGEAHQRPDRRPAVPDRRPRPEGRALPRHHPHQAHGRGAGRLPPRGRRPRPTTSTRRSTPWSAARYSGT